MAQSLHDLLLAYLPLVVFIAVAAAIGIALLLSAFLRRLQAAGSGKAFGL